MTHSTKIAAVAALVLGLAGCQGGAQNTGLAISGAAAEATQIALSPADLAQLKGTCQTAAPALSETTAPNAPPTVKDVAVYPAAFCQQLLAGAPIATTGSLTWLPTVLGYVKDAANVAGMVLPLVLPLL